MVAQCLEGQAAGWKHFIREYLPFAAAVLDRHFPQPPELRDATLREALLRARDQDDQFFRDYAGHSEREFLLHLREHALAIAEELEPAQAIPEIPLDWEVFGKALEQWSALERQIVWTFVLGPMTDDTAQILRQAPKSVEATLAKAQESLRAACDRWNPEMIAQNRRLLAEQARAGRTSDCAAPKTFLRLLDGQLTWRDRTDLERHMTACWHCVDLLCRFREIVFLTRQARPFPEPEVEACSKLLGIETQHPSRWKRLLGKG